MAEGLSVLFGPLQSLLGYFQRDRYYKDEKKDAALLAINHALIETKKYLEKNRGKEDPDREKEYELSELWAQAATKARYASTDLAGRLQDKSAYWSESLEFRWSSDEVLSRRIDIDSIEAQIKELLSQ